MAVNSFNAQNPPVTTKGDLFTFSTIPTRLGVGSNNQVLTADSTAATGLKWATPASSYGSFSLLNTGGTSMTGASVITINVTTKETYMILFNNVSAGSFARFWLNINGDLGNNYNTYGGYYQGSTPSAEGGQSQDLIYFARMGGTASEGGRGGIYVTGGSTTGGKLITSIWFSEGSDNSFTTRYSYYAASAAITSFRFESSVGNFDGGTVYIYGGH